MSAVFTPLDVSERLRQRRPIFEQHWSELLSELPEAVQKQYTAAMKQQRDPARHLLFLYFFYCGAIQAEVLSRNNTYFHMGLPVQSDQLETIDSGPGEFRCQMQLHHHSVEAALPIFRNEIVPLARRIVLYDTGIPGRNWIDYLQIIESYVSKRTRRLLTEGRPVTFTHFRFQNLNHYFGLLGEAGAGQMIHHIEHTIRTGVEKGDLTLVLSPHSYVVLSPGRSGDEVYRDFQALYFEFKSLILDYSILTHTVRDPDFSLFDVFRELKI